MKIKDIVYIGLCAIILTICSWITIPTLVPFTLGTFGVFLIALILGGKRGTATVLIYILLGVIGLPVFSGFRGGIGVLLGNTGGYILGYIFISLIMWATERWTIHKKGLRIISMILGLLVCYTCGTLWFAVTYARTTGTVGMEAILGWCVIPYIIPDLVKIGLALWVSKKVKKYVKET